MAFWPAILRFAAAGLPEFFDCGLRVCDLGCSSKRPILESCSVIKMSYTKSEFVCREGVNREKLTVKKIINNEFFFSPFASPINREKSA